MSTLFGLFKMVQSNKRKNTHAHSIVMEVVLPSGRTVRIKFGERQKFDCFLLSAVYMAVHSGGVIYDLKFIGIGGQFDM